MLNSQTNPDIAYQPELDSSSFNGNPNLRPAGIPVVMTQWQMEEYIRCATDPVYFCENYYYIINVDKGKILFPPHDYQKKIINTCIKERFIVCKLPRQCGKSTSCAAFILHSILFKPAYAVAIMANKMEQSQELLSRVQMAYEMLPKWLQQGVLTWNKRSIELENASSVICSATSGSAIRGRSLNAVILDEFAHIGRNLQQKFFTSTYPVISSGTTTKIIIISTPNGMDMFFNIWKSAIEKKNSYVPIEINWWDTPGRDQKWKEETIKNTSEQQFRQEFCVGSDTLITIKDQDRTVTIPISQLYELYSTLNLSDTKYFKNDYSLKDLMKNKKGVVYKLTRSDGLEYIGITIDFEKRLYEHVNMSSRFKTFPIIHHEILFEGDYEECLSKEEFFIKKYDTFYNGLNASIDGKGNHLAPNFTTYGFKFSEQSRKKMSRSAKKRIQRVGPPKKSLEAIKRDAAKRSEELKNKPGICYKTDYSMMKQIIKEYDEMILTPEQISVFVKSSLKEKVKSGDLSHLISSNGRNIPLWRIKIHILCKKYPITEGNLERVIKGKSLSYKEFKRA